jgi:hypothetical protein
MSSLRGRTALAAGIGGLLGSLPLVLLALAHTDLSRWWVWPVMIAGGLLGGGLGWIASERAIRELEALHEVITRAAGGDLLVAAEPSTTA